MTSTAGTAGKVKSDLVLRCASRLPLLCQGAAETTKQVRQTFYGHEQPPV